MGDDSRRSLVHSLKTEWALLWESIAGDEGEPETPFDTGKLQVLSLEDVRRLTQQLSQDRRKLNQHLESLHKELDLNNAKLESLRVVGGEDEATVRKIGELNELGQRISQELEALDSKLRVAREHEDRLRRRPTPA